MGDCADIRLCCVIPSEMTLATENSNSRGDRTLFPPLAVSTPLYVRIAVREDEVHGCALATRIWLWAVKVRFVGSRKVGWNSGRRQERQES